MVEKVAQKSIRKHRPRRSLLYVAGSNLRAISKAKQLPADVVIFDLEDSVTPDMKEKARAHVYDAIQQSNYGYRERVVRINSLFGKWGREDLRCFCNSRADAILIPKVESGGEVMQVANLMGSDGARDDMPIWAMIETPMGVQKADVICGGNYRMEALVLGITNLEKCLRVKKTPNREALQTSLKLTILAARAHGLDVFDGVFSDIYDMEGFERECHQALALGFDGKALIHPSTIDIANTVFSPTEAEIAWSMQVVEAFEKAQKEHKAVTLLKGKLVEQLHYEIAVRILNNATQIAAREKEKQEEKKRPAAE